MRILFFVLLLTGCATSRPDTTLEFTGWGKVVFTDRVFQHNVVGLYRYDNGHVITLTRGYDLERTLTHEFLHSLGLHHDSQESIESFRQKMQAYGYE